MIDPVDVSIDASSTWTMTGDSLLKSLSLAGKIDMQAPAGAFTPKTLTVASLNGQNGTLTMNVQLGGSGSAADRLVVDGGTVTGSTRLAIRNAGGLGAQTTGDGILLVQAVNGATTTAQAGKDGFIGRPGHGRRLPYQLNAGNANGQGQNWYLTSYLTTADARARRARPSSAIVRRPPRWAPPPTWPAA